MRDQGMIVKFLCGRVQDGADGLRILTDPGGDFMFVFLQRIEHFLDLPGAFGRHNAVDARE